MAIHTDTRTTMSCPTTIIPISTRSMNFGRNPTLSRSALTTTESSSFANQQLPQLTNGIVNPASSKSCQTTSIHQVCTPSYSRRRSLAKVMPTLSKKIADKNDTSQQQRKYATEASPKKVNNHGRQISSINTDLCSATRNNNVNGSHHQQQSSSADSKTPAVSCRSPVMKTPRRPSPIIHTTSGSDDETNSTRNNNKHGSVLNPTVPASAQKQKQKQQQRRLSRGGTSSPQLALPQQRRLSSPPSTTGIVKQNKTETLGSTKLQNTKKTPLGTHPAGTVTSDSGSDVDDAASTMDNHMKQQKHRALPSQSQLQTASRRTKHYRHQPILHQNDSLLLLQPRTSIASLSPSPHPNGISSSSSSTLVRRRSLADISPRSPLTPSASSTLSRHHHHQHHHHHQQQQQNDPDTKQQQQNLRHSQSHLRHPSWLDSAGFMRPSKCSICHPPPPKKSVITPPVGMGVPKFGLPPSDSSTTTTGFGGTTMATASTPKSGLDRRPSSRNSLINEKLGKYGHSFGLSSSSMALVDNARNKNSIVSTDGMARMDQRRRLSLPNTGNTNVDYSKTTTTKKLGVERRSSFYSSKGSVTSTADHNTTHRFSSKRMVVPRTKMGKQQSPDTPVLEKDFTHSPSSSSSLTEANTDTISTSSSHPSPITADESRPSTPTDMKHQMTQLMEPDYLKTLDGEDSADYPGSHDILNEHGLLKLQPSPSPVVTNDDVAQRGGNSGLIQHSMGDAFEQLQTFLDLSPTTEGQTTFSKEGHHHQQTDFEISPASLISEDTSDAAQCTSSSSSSISVSSSSSSPSLSEMSLHLQDSSNGTTTHAAHHSIQPSTLSSLPPAQLPPPSSSVLSDLEQWTTMVRLTLGRWFTDLNHGHLDYYEKAADGSITTMIITGYVVTMEADLVRPSFSSSSSSSSALAEKIHQHRYTLYLDPEERRHAFVTISSSSDSWAHDDQVSRCQFKTKSSQCECEFDWLNRRHHCRRCGDIFCKAHSTNRLPLFTRKHPDQIKWSRVCDSCCYDLVGAFLVKL